MNQSKESDIPPPANLSAYRLDHDHVLFEWPAERPSLAALTGAEVEVLRGILSGHSNDRIARERGRALRTVCNQIQSLFRKLGVKSRSEVYARWRLGDLEASREDR